MLDVGIMVIQLTENPRDVLYTCIFGQCGVTVFNLLLTANIA